MPAILDGVPESLHDWLLAAGLLFVFVLVAVVGHAVVYAVADRITRRTSGVADSAFVHHTRQSARIALILVACQVALPSAPFDPETAELVRHLLTIGMIATVSWFAIRAVHVIHDVVTVRFPVNVRDNLRARMVHTQVRVLSRSLATFIVIIAISSILMTFPRARQFGASFLASAGLAGLVVGFAARPVLGNLLAGLQLALTQPIRIDDVVIVEGEWGRIEEIRSTYVVVAIWDQRRLVVPLQYFIEHPFQNWTRKTAELLGTVFLHMDYRVPVDAVRQELTRIAQASPLWDGRVCGLQVTNATEQTVELRALVSAADSGSAWDLRCHVREKLLEYVQREHPDCLPRFRAELTSAGPRAAGEATGEAPAM